MLAQRRDGASAIGAQQDDFGPPDVLLRALRPLISAARRWRSIEETLSEIPVRIRQTRTHAAKGESQIGLFCEVETTRPEGQKKGPGQCRGLMTEFAGQNL